jgi:meiotically up-regulated gene 157 (Mug157) protein
MEFRDQVIGRGGYVASRNYELDSGAYFMTHLYDYYVAESIRRPEHLLEEPIILDAVMTMIDTWITEQRHDERSPYRYFELPFQGNGPPSGYTGMTWSAFRPSDDPCKYGYLIPANIHAAAGLQRVLILNERIWKNDELATKASKLLEDIEHGINTYGIVQDDHGESMYAYEVDGLGGVLKDFDDANVPSLLSIPLLGWDGYNRKAYENTRKYILSTSNQHYSEGSLFTGLGSPHTPELFIWPIAMVIQGLTEDGPDRVDKMAFQMRQLLKSARNDTMHESVHKDIEDLFTREWFEWANALFVVYVETVTGASCSVPASKVHGATTILAYKAKYAMENPSFYQESYNDPWDPRFYQNVVASIHFDSDVESPQVLVANFDFPKEPTDRVESGSNFPNPLADNFEKNMDVREATPDNIGSESEFDASKKTTR